MSQSIYPPVAYQAQAVSTETDLYAEAGKTYSQTLTKDVELRVSDAESIKALNNIIERLEVLETLFRIFLGRAV